MKFINDNLHEYKDQMLLDSEDVEGDDDDIEHVNPTDWLQLHRFKSDFSY